MGDYVDPGNENFAAARRDDIFVDKSGLIRFTNNLIGKRRNKICVTRPRRFGKSLAVDMLTAYYSRGCDSRVLFQDLEIARDPTFEQHLNRYHVIRIDVQYAWKNAIDMRKEEQMLDVLKKNIMDELTITFPGILFPRDEGLGKALKYIYSQDNPVRFIFLLDEWDVLFRNAKVSQELREDYLSLLVGLFKSLVVDPCIALVYMTGILPVIKYFKGTDNQSTLNNFMEYSMIRPRVLAEYMGFTEPEVDALCEKWDMSLDDVREWYDGYQMGKTGSIYCPESVCMAMINGCIDNYWAGTSGFQVLRDFLQTGMPRLKDAVESLVAGEHVSVDPMRFSNNVNMIESANDVLTVLVHYGYLSYEASTDEVRIPNREVKREIRNAIEEMDSAEYSSLQEIMCESMGLLRSTWEGDEAAVARQIQKVHDYRAAPLTYNSEEALRSVISLAYIAADAYYTMIPELPTGKGFADIAFLPRDSRHPAMILELKWNQTAETALSQIKARNYQGRLKHCKKILLVGISYEKGTKKEPGKEHTCSIQVWEDTNP